MNLKLLHRWFAAITCITALCLLQAAPVLGQTYGVGWQVNVPKAASAITIDGMADEAAWDDAAEFNLMTTTSFWTEAAPVADLSARAKVLYGDNTLYVYVFVDDNELFTNSGQIWESDAIFVGIDPAYRPGDTDRLVDQSGWEGWPANAPDKGPYAYKVHMDGTSGKFTLNWGFGTPDPEAEGWVDGQVFIDEENNNWGFEAAFNVPGMGDGDRVGFNIGGSQANAEAGITYGYFAQWATENPGGDIFSRTDSYGTLILTPSGTPVYGVGVDVVVPAASGAITIDGMADEAAWDKAQEFDLVAEAAFWTEAVPEPDLKGRAKVLFDTNTLYVHALIEDNDLFTNSGQIWESDAIFVGIDPAYRVGDTDQLVDQSSWAGWPENAPDKGPYAYKVHMDGTSGKFTLNWGFSTPDPEAEGWVDGVVFFDEEAKTWGFEAAFNVPGIAEGDKIGFNIGGSQASAEAGQTYGHFSQWSSENPGGDIFSRTDSYGTLTLGVDMGAPAVYGAGVTRRIPFIPATIINPDGVPNEPAWDTGAEFNLVANTSWWHGDFPAVDIEYAVARAYYTTDTLYLFVQIEDNDLFTHASEPWNSDHILIGIDPVHVAGESDMLVDNNWAGWPQNAPDKGPYTYKIQLTEAGGDITLNWGFADIDPVAEGWVRGSVFRDDENNNWGVEMAVFVPGLTGDSEIGFNIGGGQASSAAGFAYGNFSWQAGQYPGGDVQRTAKTFGTLRMEPTADRPGYGVGLEVQVSQADQVMVMDGRPDEAAWADAQEFDLLQYSAFYAVVSEPDLEAFAKVLWADDTLYVYTIVYDNEIFVPEDPGIAWQSDQVLIGIDPVHVDGLTDVMIDGGWSGWPGNAPDRGPHTYKVWPVENGFTLNWGFNDIDPVTEGWARGAVFVDEGFNEWGFEAAFYVPGIRLGSQIGFNIGGAQASQTALDQGEGEATYGFFSWQVVNPDQPGSAGGDVMNVSASFATLRLVEEIGSAIEQIRGSELPERIALHQNYPNPFNPSTSFQYDLPQAAHATLTVYNTLGQQVARLVDEPRQAGTHRVNWQIDSQLSTGVYFYQLRIDGNVVETRKMLFMK